MLLLDEPLGALDLKLRKTMQIELKHLQMQLGITFVYVTHDQEEALIMSDRIAVMNEGRILQVDDPISIYEKPATRFVADFIGESNFLNGSIDEVDADRVYVRLAEDVRLPCPVNGNGFHKGDRVTLAVRPEKVETQASQRLRGQCPGRHPVRRGIPRYGHALHRGPAA